MALSLLRGAFARRATTIVKLCACRTFTYTPTSTTSRQMEKHRQKYHYMLPSDLVESHAPRIRDALDVIANGDMTQVRQAEKLGWIRQFEQRPGDHGSGPVQIACMTVRLNHLAEHLARNKQDKRSKRAYLYLLARRRKLMAHLRRTDFEGYCRAIKELGLTGFT